MSCTQALAKLGFVLGIISCFFFAWASYYSGVLLAQVRNKHYPTARSFKDLAGQMIGPRMEWWTSVGIVVQWCLTTPYYLMVSPAAAAASTAARLE